MATLKYMTENGKVHTSIEAAEMEREKITEGTSSGNIRYLTSDCVVHYNKKDAILHQRKIEVKHVIWNEDQRNYWRRFLGASKIDEILTQIVMNREELIIALTEDL